jgi:L-fucose mutarotase
MLKGLHPLLSADILYLLARMGHGDDLAIVDLNHPAETVATATTSGVLIRAPGVRVEAMLAAVLTVLPLDTFTDDPVRFMQPVDAGDTLPEAIRDMQQATRDGGFAGAFSMLERFAFYEAARASFGVIQCGDPRFYGNVLLRKGAIETPVS